MTKFAVAIMVLLAQVTATAQITERVCPESERQRNEAEARRITELVQARCTSPWHSKTNAALKNFWDGFKAPVTLDAGFFGERVVRFGLSMDAYDILTFDGLDEVLEECYPNSPAKRVLFRQALIAEEGAAAVGTATFAVVGYLTVRFVGGKLKAAGWLPLADAANKIGISERWLKTILYGTALVGASLAWSYYNQVGDIGDLTRLDRVAGDIESATKVAQSTGVFVEEVQLNRLRDLCSQAARDANAAPGNLLAAENRDYVCTGYRQRAEEVLMQLNDKINSCESKLPDVERARERVSAQLAALLF